MAATVETRFYFGATPSGTNAEALARFNREDNLTGTSAVPIPTSLGTNFSWHKAFAFVVTAGGGATTISNRKVYSDGAPTAGLNLWYTLFTTDTYAQATATLAADNATESGHQPEQGSYGQAWAAVPSSAGAAATWDSASVAAANATKNGKYLVIGAGVGSAFAGGAGVSTALPDIKLMYDEA